MTNPKKMVEKLIQSAKDAEYQAYSDVEDAIALLSEYTDDHSEKWQESEKGQAYQEATLALNCVLLRVLYNFDHEPYIYDL